MMDFWPRIVLHTLFQFKDHIIKSNYALNFIIFNVMLAVFSSSVLPQLYPSSLTVSSFSGESAAHHLWVWASLFCFDFFFFNLILFLCVSQCFGRGTVTSIISAGRSLHLMLSGHWGEKVVASDWGKQTIFNSGKFCRSPGSASTWTWSFGGAAQEITHSHPLSL